MREGFNMKKLSKNKKAAIENLVKVVLWIVFFVALSAGVYFLIKSLNGA